MSEKEKETSLRRDAIEDLLAWQFLFSPAVYLVIYPITTILGLFVGVINLVVTLFVDCRALPKSLLYIPRFFFSRLGLTILLPLVWLGYIFEKLYFIITNRPFPEFLRKSYQFYRIRVFTCSAFELMFTIILRY